MHGTISSTIHFSDSGFLLNRGVIIIVNSEELSFSNTDCSIPGVYIQFSDKTICSRVEIIDVCRVERR